MPEVGPEDRLVVRGVDVLVLVFNITDPYPEAFSGAGDIAVDQLIDFLSTNRSVHSELTTILAQHVGRAETIGRYWGLWRW